MWLAIATTQMAKLIHIWKNREVVDKIKIQLIKALVNAVALYGCELWTLSKQLEKKIAAFEIWCYQQLLGVHWRDHHTNESVLEEIRVKIGQFEQLMDTVKRMLQWFGHVTTRPGTLAHMVMHGLVNEKRGWGQPQRSWLEDVRRWVDKPVEVCVQMAKDREKWRKTTLPQWPTGYGCDLTWSDLTQNFSSFHTPECGLRQIYLISQVLILWSLMMMR